MSYISNRRARTQRSHRVNSFSLCTLRSFAAKSGASAVTSRLCPSSVAELLRRVDAFALSLAICPERPNFQRNQSPNDRYRQVRTRIDTSNYFVGSNVTQMPKTEHRTSNIERRTPNAGRNRRNPLIFRIRGRICGFISHRKFLIFRNLSHPTPVKTAYFIGYFTPKYLIFRALRKNRGEFKFGVRSAEFGIDRKS